MHKRIWGSLSRHGIDKKAGQENGEKATPDGDSPEASVARGVRLFCESGGPNNSGEEVLHLPIIVEAAESSPSAATEAAIRIRKFLSKENYQRAYVQYNAMMLVRILADNPGKSFTRNIDPKFVSTVKELLRDGKDMSVQQILRETLDNFQTQKVDDETLYPLREMWRKEKVKMEKRGSNVQIPRNMIAPAYNQNPQQQQNYFARNHRPHGLPPPAELAQRVEEAKTSAKLLSQVVQSTPPAEVLGNELIKEFVERCQSASRSIQSYIHSDNPAPDEDTLLTLIETNDQLATAMSRHQHALLQARRVTGVSPSPLTHRQTQNGPFEAPTGRPDGPSRGQSFSPPAGSLPRKQSLFGDYNEANHPSDNLQTPLVPQSYGLPPSIVTEENNQPSSYRPGYQGYSSYANRQKSPTVSTTMHGGDADDEAELEEEVRRPVQYRF